MPVMVLRVVNIRVRGGCLERVCHPGCSGHDVCCYCYAYGNVISIITHVVTLYKYFDYHCFPTSEFHGLRCTPNSEL